MVEDSYGQECRADIALVNGYMHKRKLLCVLRALMEEWGVENVAVALPRKWEAFGQGQIGMLSTHYVTEHTICITVEHKNGRITYEIDSQRIIGGKGSA